MIYRVILRSAATLRNGFQAIHGDEALCRLPQPRMTNFKTKIYHLDTLFCSCSILLSSRCLWSSRNTADDSSDHRATSNVDRLVLLERSSIHPLVAFFVTYPDCSIDQTCVPVFHCRVSKAHDCTYLRLCNPSTFFHWLLSRLNADNFPEQFIIKMCVDVNLFEDDLARYSTLIARCFVLYELKLFVKLPDL
jgi:hypothetical protein